MTLPGGKPKAGSDMRGKRWVRERGTPGLTRITGRREQKKRIKKPGCFKPDEPAGKEPATGAARTR